MRFSIAIVLKLFFHQTGSKTASHDDGAGKQTPGPCASIFSGVLRWDNEKLSFDFASHIENNFNFKALQAMLDK